MAGQQPVRGGLPAATEAFASTKANRTSMAHRGLSDDRRLVFSQVELGGLEPPTPCLQSMAKTSSTVHGLARSVPQRPSAYSNVQARWCRLWVSSRPTGVHLRQANLSPHVSPEAAWCRPIW